MSLIHSHNAGAFKSVQKKLAINDYLFGTLCRYDLTIVWISVFHKLGEYLYIAKAEAYLRVLNIDLNVTFTAE